LRVPNLIPEECTALPVLTSIATRGDFFGIRTHPYPPIESQRSDLLPIGAARQEWYGRSGIKASGASDAFSPDFVKAAPDA
jgi:hypothetical protein